MLLIEADGKKLLAAYGIPVPRGHLVTNTESVEQLPGTGPWMVKAQVPVGGRGKAGGILRCDTRESVSFATKALIGRRLKGHEVRACLVEEVSTGEERYLSVMVDPPSYGIRVIYLAGGGVDVETSAGEARSGRICSPDIHAITAAIAEIASVEPARTREVITELGRRLGQLVIERELVLAEINPLFVGAQDGWAGDAKVVVDLNALDRQPEIRALIDARPEIYLDAHRKIHEGFDYVELNPHGEIGLLTTGAGLSMMLIDELTTRGRRPLNFCDVRTSQLRGNPQRLLRVLGWMAERPSLRVVFVNIFAGITDLREFAGLLAAALDGTPDLHVPVVARLVGNGAEGARQILAERRPDVFVEESMETALDRVTATTAGIVQ
jgi:succinyl-CoA synthetase beta subunit